MHSEVRRVVREHRYPLRVVRQAHRHHYSRRRDQARPRLEPPAAAHTEEAARHFPGPEEVKTKKYHVEREVSFSTKDNRHTTYLASTKNELGLSRPPRLPDPEKCLIKGSCCINPPTTASSPVKRESPTKSPIPQEAEIFERTSNQSLAGAILTPTDR